MNWLVATTIASAVVLQVYTREKPRLPWLPATAAFLLFGMGWWMAWNAHTFFEPKLWLKFPMRHSIASLPGAIDRIECFREMWRISALLGWFVVVLVWARQSGWRKTILFTMGVTGFSLAVFGIVQRALGAQDIFWGSRLLVPLFFATFRYHANAGAFFNLVWPIVAFFFVLNLQRKVSPWSKAIWPVAFLVVTATVFIHGSRAASVIAVPMILSWVVLFRRPLLEAFFSTTIAVRWTAGILVILLLIGALVGGNIFIAHSHWLELVGQLEGHEARLRAYQAALPMIPDAGWFGMGVGCFKWMFPFYTVNYGTSLGIGLWIYLHQDYIQTIIEWGYLGAFLWAVIFFGSVIRAAWLLYLPLAVVPKEDRYILRTAILGLLVVLLHALVDFPLQIASIQLYALSLCGLAWGIPVPRVTSNRKMRNKAGATSDLQ
jgi:O-Antigen ligase